MGIKVSSVLRLSRDAHRCNMAANGRSRKAANAAFRPPGLCIANVLQVVDNLCRIGVFRHSHAF
jgi:hypothetical protein